MGKVLNLSLNINSRQHDNVGISLLPTTVAKLLYWWKGKYDGDNLLSELDSTVITVVGKDFTNGIPSTSSAILHAPVSFNVPDTDEIWYTSGNAQRDTTPVELVTYDFGRTIVKYSDVNPLIITEIIILADGETLTEAEINNLHEYAHLSVWWTGTLNLYGYFKSNRAMSKAVWSTSGPPNGVTSSIAMTVVSDSDVNLTWTNGSTDEDGISIERSTDGTNYTEINTVGAGIAAYSDTTAPASTRCYYRVRAFRGEFYSDYSNVIDDYTATPIALTGQGFGTNMGIIRFRVLSGTRTAKITGTNVVWCASNGTEQPSDEQSITTGALRSLYFKVKNGAGATGKILVFAKGDLASFGDSGQTGFVSVTDNSNGGTTGVNGPYITVDMSKMSKATYNFRTDSYCRITGTVNDIPDNVVYFRVVARFQSYTAGKSWSNSINYFRFNGEASFGLSTSAMVDNLIHDLSLKTWAGASKLCQIDGANPVRTTASNADKASLEAQGVTCTFNGP